MISKIVVAVCVGHSRKGDKGAINTAGVSEYEFNRKVGSLLQSMLERKGYDAVLFDSYSGNGYASAMRWVGEQCKLIKASCAVELHFNAAGPFAEGHEWLYWGRSASSKRLAESFDSCFRKRFPENVARGAKPLGLDQRGNLFLRLTPCPSVILEPFFGSNKMETAFFASLHEALAEVYADAIDDYLSGSGKPN